MTQHDTIRTARSALNMSQAALADAAGISERTVKRAESGSPLSPETAQALSSVLGLPPGILASGQGAIRIAVIETTLTDAAMDTDPRRETLEGILASGVGSHVIVPDPGLLGALASSTASSERIAHRIELVMYATLPAGALILLLLFVMPVRLVPVTMASGLALAAASGLGLLLYHISTLGLVAARRRLRFARESILVVDGDLLHVVRVSEGEEIIISGVPARSALDRFSGMPQPTSVTRSAPALA